MQNNSFMRYPLMDLSEIYYNFDHVTSFDLTKFENESVKPFNGFCYPRFIKLHECILHSINNELFGEEDNEIDNPIKSDKHIDERRDYLQEAFNFYQKKNFDNDENMYKSYIKKDC